MFPETIYKKKKKKLSRDWISSFVENQCRGLNCAIWQKNMCYMHYETPHAFLGQNEATQIYCCTSLGKMLGRKIQLA